MAAKDLSIVFTSLPRFTDICLLYDDGVCRSTFYATDKSLGQRRVVVKGFQCSNEKCQQVITDICELRKLSHQNIATVLELLTIENSAKTVSVQSMKHICLVQELLDVDIRNLLSSCNQLTSRHRRLFAYQLFAALRHAHSAGISHLGLKPANVLISVRDLTLKIADFGICMIKKEVETDESEVCWYQAPEQLLKTTELTSAVGFPADIWSGGCLVAEILTGRPLFTGTDQMDQLLRMIDAIQLRDDDWTKVLNVMPNKLLKNHPFRPRSPLRSQLVAKCDRQAIHLLELLLTFNTDERITADEAMSNIYFAGLRHGDASELHNEWAINYQNEMNKERGALPTSSSTSRLSVDTATVGRGTSGRPNCRSDSNDIALHNFLNNHNSPTSESADRTPSPNILDLLQSQESEQLPKRRSEASDSDGEKEIAEISDEKLKEDLEVGNVSVELLRRLRTSLICGDVDLPDILASVRNRISEIAPSLPADDDASIPEVTCSYFGENTDDVSKVTRDFLEFIAKQAEYDELFRKPAATVGEGDGKSSSDDFNNSKLTVVTSPHDKNEDSNKRNTGARISCDKKEKFLDSAAGEPHECSGCSEHVPKAVCTKILMERIESEKSAVRNRRRRSGIASPTATRQYHRNLTSEEFDELYRLPTEHLRKDMPQHVGIERSSRSGISDRHHRHQRHHSHDSFHTSNGHRHAFTDDDCSLRDVEGGACGGVDYAYCYDDMSMTHHMSTIDATSAAMSSFHRQADVVCSAGCFLSTRDDWVDVSNVADLSLARIPMLTVGRDTTSSPESPASPQTAQAGARPKKSHRKHRPL